MSSNKEQKLEGYKKLTLECFKQHDYSTAKTYLDRILLAAPEDKDAICMNILLNSQKRNGRFKNNEKVLYPGTGVLREVLNIIKSVEVIEKLYMTNNAFYLVLLPFAETPFRGNMSEFDRWIQCENLSVLDEYILLYNNCGELENNLNRMPLRDVFSSTKKFIEEMQQRLIARENRKTFFRNTIIFLILALIITFVILLLNR